MSDETPNNIIENPLANLRRRVEILEEQVKNLKREREHMVQTQLHLVERYEEARKLFIQGLELFKNSSPPKKDP